MNQTAITVAPSVGSGSLTYDVMIGPNLLEDAGHIIDQKLKRPRVIIISDTSVWSAAGDRLASALTGVNISFETVLLPPGEHNKSFQCLEGLLDRLLALNVERLDVLVAFGGGVIGDLTGFAAAILRRGVDFIQIPTSLLAQVDSSVGGKTGINSPRGKNLIGAFYQPVLVLADLGVLKTLPDRHMRAGYAEIVKYGLINDAKFFDWLEKNGSGVITGDTTAQIYAVRQSVAAKANIVGRDAHEKSVRALLNLGHTFGHALEAETGYNDTLYHGEAVAIGLMLALETSYHMGWVDAGCVARVRSHLDQIGLPVRITDTDIPAGQDGPDPKAVDTLVTRLWSHMQQDKKISGGEITFVMMRGIGQAFLTREVPESVIKTVIRSSLTNHLWGHI